MNVATPLLVALSLATVTGAQSSERPPAGKEIVTRRWAVPGQDLGSKRALLNDATPGERALVVYDVSDLVEPDAEAYPVAEERAIEVANRLEFVRETLLSAVEGLAPADVIGTTTRIVVSASTAQHAAVSRYFDLQRASKDDVFILNFILMKLPPEELDALDLADEQATFHSGRPVDVDAMKSGKGEVLQAPLVAVRNAQEARLATFVQQSYIAGYDVHEDVAPTGQMVIDPIVCVLQEGVRIRCRAVRTTATHVTVEFTLVHSELAEPLEEKWGEHGPYCEPEVNTVTVASTLVLPEGTVAALPAVTNDGEAIVVLVEMQFADSKAYGRK